MVDVSVKRKIDRRCAPGLIAAKIKELRKRLQVDQAVFAEHLGVSQNTISEWEKGDHPPQAMALMAIGRLDIDNTMWWYEQAGPKFADRLKTVQLVEEARAARRAQAEPGESPAWDPELLTFVIETIDAELKKRRKSLPIGKYAELVVLIYEYCHKLGSRDSDIVVRLLKIA